jgi:hypothetical protein
MQPCCSRGRARWQQEHKERVGERLTESLRPFNLIPPEQVYGGHGEFPGVA